jgi:hypothetical protein
MNKFAEAPERSKCEAAFVRPSLLYYLSCTHVPYLTEMTKHVICFPSSFSTYLVVWRMEYNIICIIN